MNLIVLNDLRSVPILTVIKLRKCIDSSLLIAHDSIFDNAEYADFTPRVWKKCVKWFLVRFFKLHLISSSSEEVKSYSQTGLTSSLLSITEDSGANKLKYPKIYKQMENLAAGAADIVKYISANKKDILSIYLFNGRTASSFDITKYAVQNNITVMYYEFAGHCNGFRLFPVPPHASGSLGELLLHYYRYGSHRLANLQAAAEKLRNDKIGSEFAIKNKSLPDKEYDVVIFIGSDFEYTSIDQDICGITWNGNPEFCKRVIEKYGDDYTYAIRCHPNSARDPNWPALYSDLTNTLASLKPVIDIYGSESTVDSHQLIRDAKFVVTDLSTIALDAIFLGANVDIFGNTDIKYIYNDDWMCAHAFDNKPIEISRPFALGHNFLVFRFSVTEKFLCNILYYLVRLFFKFSIWRDSVLSKNNS